MNRHCLTTAALLAAFPVAVMGETYEVSNASSVALETGDVVSAVTTDIPDALPDVGSTPLFHLDASQTNGWVFASGTNAVTKIPSLVGSRYLYVKPNSEFWSQLPRGKDGSATWNANDYWKPLAPQFTYLRTRLC